MNRKGFTLIELLIVIAIIGFLAAAILVAVDPVRRIQESRDARRSEETTSILNAVLNYQTDNREQYDGETDAPIITQGGDNVQVIVRDISGVDCNTQATRPGCDQPMDVTPAFPGPNLKCVAHLSGVVPQYIAELPIDPRGEGKQLCETGTVCTTNGDMILGDHNTGYYIARTAGGRLEIGACKPERTTDISVKR